MAPSPRFALAILLAVPSVLAARQEPVARQMILQQPARASTDSTNPLTVQLIERWGNTWSPALRTLPKRRIGLRITIPGSDSALARRRGQRLSVSLFVYGDGVREDRRDSLIVSAATTSLERSEPAGWHVDVDLGELEPSDSALVSLQENGARSALVPVWRRPSGTFRVPVLYGNVKMPKDTLEQAMRDDPASFIRDFKVRGDPYSLTPQGSGDLPPRRPALLALRVMRSSGLLPWLRDVRLEMVRRRGTTVVDITRFPLPAFKIATESCRPEVDGALPDAECTAYAFLGRVPIADSVEVYTIFRSDTTRVMVWRERSSQFLVALGLGTVFPLNRLSAGDTLDRLAPRIGFNGRVIITDLEPEWVIGRIALGNLELFRGPVILEGELSLGLATLQSGVPDSNRYEQATTANLRGSIPLADFGRAVTLRGFYEIGSTSIRDSTALATERYWGLRLGLDAADVSGRQSFVEFSLGRSDVLSPRTRQRITVQFKIPTTNIVFQFVNNFSRGKKLPQAFAEMSTLSAFVPLGPNEVLQALGLIGARE